MNNRTLTKTQHHINEALRHEDEADALVSWGETLLTVSEETEATKRAAELQKLANHEWLAAVIQLLNMFK